jgi:DNA-binding PadR family transcriptional regulator
VYAITDQGRNELKTWLHLPVETESLRLEILLKMYFAALGNLTTMHDHVETFLASHQKDLMILNMFKKELETIEDPYQNHQYILSVIDFGIKTNEAYLNWSQEALHMLQAKENHDETK